METFIVYLDDAAHASQSLASLHAQAAGRPPRHFILVACAPRMTHRISKWVSHRTRENWRDKWADKLFDQVLPLLRGEGDGDRVTPVLAKVPLPELTRCLQAEHGAASVVDLRRPKAAGDRPEPPGWKLPGPMMGLGAALLLAVD